MRRARVAHNIGDRFSQHQRKYALFRRREIEFCRAHIRAHPRRLQGGRRLLDLGRESLRPVSPNCLAHVGQGLARGQLHVADFIPCLYRVTI